MDLVFSRTKKIPSKSWGQECSLCSSRHGVPIECSARGCKVAYHTTCAIRGKLKMQAIFGKNFKGGIKLRSYCKDHSPNVSEKNGILSQDDKIDASGVKEIDMTNLADDRIQENNEELDYFWKYVDINEVHKNLTDAYARTRRLRAAAAKQAELANDSESTPKKSKKAANKLNSSPDKLPKTVKSSEEKNYYSMTAWTEDPVPREVDPLLLDLIYRYWILLRTVNNGQSLIKFSPSALKEREFEQRKNIMKLRIELERVRNLSYMIGKREKLKSSWLKAHQNIIKRTFVIINDLDPASDQGSMDATSSDDTSTNQLLSAHHNINPLFLNSRKFPHSTLHVQPTNGMFDESEQLINDLITCDQIYDLPNSSNSNHNNLTPQEQSTLERRRTLSLVRRINRQLKSVSVEPSLNPYAKSYLAPKRSDSPMESQLPLGTTKSTRHR